MSNAPHSPRTTHQKKSSVRVFLEWSFFLSGSQKPAYTFTTLAA